LRKSRKTIGVEAEYVELLKQIAVSRGMSIATYLKRLIEESVKIEEMGYFAPRALSERRIELILSKLGFTIMPWDITSEPTSDEIALERGLVIGKTLRELGLNPVEVIELIGLSNQLIVIQGDNIIILPQYDPLRRKLSLLLKGIAKGAGLSIIESGETTIIMQSKRMSLLIG
jgi:hypothetical protein